MIRWYQAVDPRLGSRRNRKKTIYFPSIRFVIRLFSQLQTSACEIIKNTKLMDFYLGVCVIVKFVLYLKNDGKSRQIDNNKEHLDK